MAWEKWKTPRDPGTTKINKYVVERWERRRREPRNSIGTMTRVGTGAMRVQRKPDVRSMCRLLRP